MKESAEEQIIQYKKDILQRDADYNEQTKDWATQWQQLQVKIHSSEESLAVEQKRVDVLQKENAKLIADQKQTMQNLNDYEDELKALKQQL